MQQRHELDRGFGAGGMDTEVVEPLICDEAAGGHGHDRCRVDVD